MNFNVMFGRALRAAKLDITLYSEVEADTSLNREALTVVIIAVWRRSLARLSAPSSLRCSAAYSERRSALYLAGSRRGCGLDGHRLLHLVVPDLVHRHTIFGGTAEPGELMRTIGYAYAPQWLNVLNFIPCVGGLLSIVVSIWSLVAGIIAIREALDFDTEGCHHGHHRLVGDLRSRFDHRRHLRGRDDGP